MVVWFASRSLNTIFCKNIQEMTCIYYMRFFKHSKEDEGLFFRLDETLFWTNYLLESDLNTLVYVTGVNKVPNSFWCSSFMTRILNTVYSHIYSHSLCLSGTVLWEMPVRYRALRDACEVQGLRDACEVQGSERCLWGTGFWEMPVRYRAFHISCGKLMPCDKMW